MNANLLRRVNWLWKHRHTHDADTLQQQITIIRQTVEQQAEAPGSGTGAHIHLLMTTPQTIASGGDSIEWTGENSRHFRYEFGAMEFPSADIVIPKTAYYDIHVTAGWSTYTTGGTVEIVRTRGGVDFVLWPSSEAPGRWTASDGAEFDGTAGKTPLLAGDVISVFIDHGDVSSHDLAYATLAVGLVDRDETPGWEFVFEANNYGVTWDGTNWWTTDHADDVDPALFKRAADGAIVASYAGFDVSTIVKRNRGIVFAASFLWGVANEENVYKVDPADGTTVSTFAVTPTTGTHTGIGYNGTNLFVVEFSVPNIQEYNLTGTLQATHSHPSGRVLVDLTWDGENWLATTTTAEVVSMDTSFGVTGSFPGPTATNRGCHYRDGFLYVMTSSGLYRRAF